MKEGEGPGPDWDLFRQCATCGTIYGLHEVKTEQSVSGFAQTSENPFDSQKSFIMSASPRRNSKEGRKQMAKKKRKIKTT